MSTFLAWFLSQQRAVRWAILALVAILFYFIAVEPIIDRTLAAGRAADTRETTLRTLHTRAVSGDADAELLAVRKFGRAEIPGDPNARTLKLNQQVTAVLEKNGVRRHSSSTKLSPLETGPMTEFTAKTAPTEQVSRFVREVQFEASPEAVAAVVADLEKLPEITGVSRVQLRRSPEADRGERLVRATVSVEAWVQAPRSQGRTR